MFFPAGERNALEIVRSYNGGMVDRDMVEAALDFYILIEPDSFGRGGGDTAKFTKEINNARRMIRRYGELVMPLTLEKLQDQFYSFSNSDKYRYSRETISVVRTVISSAWEGLAGWRD
jgi:hypothetical protein